MALVLMTKTRQRLAIGQSNPTLRPFQGLNGWFFIDGQDQRIPGRIEIETHNVGALRANSGSVEMHQLWRRSNSMPAWRKMRQT